MDRISQLPNPILQHILCYLPPEQAIRSCILSKSWRYICWALPKFQLCESFFRDNRNKKTFIRFKESALIRYQDLGLPLPEFLLEIPFDVDPEFLPLLETLTHEFFRDIPVKKFSLNFFMDCVLKRSSLWYFLGYLPEILCRTESLEELYLTGCDLSYIKGLFRHLRTLSLDHVRISEVILQRIISGCPSIEYVTVRHCYFLGSFKVRNLKRFDFADVRLCKEDYDAYSIEIDAPSIECIRIKSSRNWLHLADHLSFRRLKSLHLSFVCLSENSFHRFSVDFCCLEELTLEFCYGFEEFKLVSSSIKRLSLEMVGLKKAAIDVPNIKCFKLAFVNLPSISFTTTSDEWKSKISVLSTMFHDCHHRSSTLLEIYELHKAALCHSEFSLHIADPWEFLPGSDAGSCPPVVIENLSIGVNPCLYSIGSLLGHLFCFFRPRNIQLHWCANPGNEYERAGNQLIECLSGIFADNNQLGLEQVLMELSGERGEERECGLSDNRKQKIRFRYRLKWES